MLRPDRGAGGCASCLMLQWAQGKGRRRVPLPFGSHARPCVEQAPCALLLPPTSHAQLPVAMDSSGWHLVLAFAPLEIKLYK